MSNADMVRNEIQHLAHAVRLQLRDQGVIIRARTYRGVHLVMISDVVAVQALGASLKIGRRINIAHAQLVQIRQDLARLRKREPPIKLQSVSAGWDAWMFRGHSRNFLSFRAKSRNPVALVQHNFAGDPSTPLCSPQDDTLRMKRVTSARALQCREDPGRAATLSR